jgi:DNA-directed RNA polymerase specialized sigma subunit
MKAKEYLSQALWLNQRIDNKLEQLERLKAMAMRVTTNLTQEKVSGGYNERNPMENTIVKIMDLEREVNDEIDKLINLKQEILETISLVDDPMAQLLLEMRYINRRTWGEIAGELGYSDRGIHKIHGRALKEIDEIRKSAVKCSEVHTQHMI